MLQYSSVIIELTTGSKEELLPYIGLLNQERMNLNLVHGVTNVDHEHKSNEPTDQQYSSKFEQNNIGQIFKNCRIE